MPYYQDNRSKALMFFKDEPDLPGNWERLFDPDGYHKRTYDSLDALWRLELARQPVPEPGPDDDIVLPPRRKTKADA